MNNSSITTILAALLAGGLLNLVWRAFMWVVDRFRKSQPAVVESKRIHDAVREADQSLLVVAKARDELAEDNNRLREQVESERRRHEKQSDTERCRYEKDRADWRAERTSLRQEIEKLEAALRSIQDEIQQMKARYGMT